MGRFCYVSAPWPSFTSKERAAAFSVLAPVANCVVHYLSCENDLHCGI